jgi:hypothetical protein
MTDQTTEPVASVVVPGMKLGKLPAKFDRRTIQMSDKIEKRKLPKIPLTHTLSKKTLVMFPKLGIMGNDDYGDCTFAAIGHMHQTWTTYGGKPWQPTDAEIIAAYLKHTGGRDEGANMLDVLKLMRNEGIAGNKIDAFVAISLLNHDQVRTAHFLFGGLYVGAMLPQSAQTQMGKEWDVIEGNGAAPGSWGGHCMSVIDYTKRGPVVVTWGKLQKMTWAFWDRYFDEGFVVLEQGYIGDDKRSPQGFSMKKLADDLKSI